MINAVNAAYNIRRHPPTGSINSTAYHGLQAWCTCQGPTPPGLGGVPIQCQWDRLRADVRYIVLALGPGGRFKAYEIWKLQTGVHVERERDYSLRKGEGEGDGKHAEDYDSDIGKMMAMSLTSPP